ncbi:glycosyltransferase [Acidimicrobiaceae bacterium]|nr:glycosyltransferase [Acidimicrobiaceae bacterium]
MSSYSNILYIFGSGRKKKILENDLDSSEFFYGYFHMKSKFKNIDSIEMLPNEIDLKKHQLLLEFIDKILRKLTNLPFYIHLMFSKKNLTKIKKSDLIISTNDRLAISAMPMILYSKLRSVNKNFFVIVMGLFSKKRDRKTVAYLQKLFLNFIIKKINFFIFLGKGEYQLAIEMFPKFKDKFRFIPFGINLDFWNSEKAYDPKKNEYLLFVGNDGNRDFDQVVEICNNLKNIEIKIITSQEISNKIKNENVEVIYGNWHSTAISDQKLKEYYENALLTFLPIKETYQPSGQSVALQSMSLGIPVAITQTRGFWDIDKFNHMENIVFIEKNSTENWTNTINKLLSDKNLLDHISKKSISTVNKHYNQDDFFLKMEQLI